MKSTRFVREIKSFIDWFMLVVERSGVQILTVLIVKI